MTGQAMLYGTTIAVDGNVEPAFHHICGFLIPCAKFFSSHPWTPRTNRFTKKLYRQMLKPTDKTPPGSRIK